MRSSSLKLALKHGIKSPKLYRDNLIHNWFLTDEDRQHLEVFFQAKEYSEELENHIRNGAYYIGEKEYQITWVNKPETIFHAEYALLSFRYCSLLRCGYVLIRELKGEDTSGFDFVEYPKEDKE